MENLVTTGAERVAKLLEICDGAVLRTFYAIHDPQFGHWMSDEPFGGAIWTKDVRRRLEFSRRRSAEAHLIEFQDWRDEREASQECEVT